MPQSKRNRSPDPLRLLTMENSHNETGMHPSKDYPSFHSLFNPLVVYFEILQFFIISSGNIPAIQQVFSVVLSTPTCSTKSIPGMSGLQSCNTISCFTTTA
ncbi:hypothetical protein K439DRAFT_1557246 [Ramaria rubella]|nr:hypothetical protein K439DRAFT_1557246 [Ramaria rubella]